MSISAAPEKSSTADLTTQIAAWLRLFCQPHQVVELRALHVRRRYGTPATIAGFFDGEHLREMAEAALDLDGSARGVYFTLNPVNRALLARRANRVDVAEQGDLTTDKDVRHRRWLPVDIDPFRPAGVSATDREKALSLALTRRVRAYLRKQHWPEPIFADSGNGYHLLYPIVLPGNDNGTVERSLKKLAAYFDRRRVAIDTTVHNPARIIKLYGTLARKGDDIPERPHRRSRIIEVPT